MKAEIHPNYRQVNVTCSCGNKFATGSTYRNTELHVDTCANCHPFYTGKQKVMDTAGRVERFNKKFGGKKNLLDAAN